VAWREQDEEPGIWVEFEWLARMMAEEDRKAGTSRSLDPAALARSLPSAVNQMRQAVEIDEQLRMVTVRVASLPIRVSIEPPQRREAGGAGESKADPRTD
jgi:hypothetical protein